MAHRKDSIPLFPLNLLPLPGELVPLHIFEPRYKQLLQDAEATDICFGIYFENPLNSQKIGSYMRLESIIKRYPNGEADIIVKCIDIFTLLTFQETHKEKLYPGGSVQLRTVDVLQPPNQEVYELFIDYQSNRNINQRFITFSLYQIANELGFDLRDRYRFLTVELPKQVTFLINRLKFQIRILKREKESRSVFHLN